MASRIADAINDVLVDQRFAHRGRKAEAAAAALDELGDDLPEQVHVHDAGGPGLVLVRAEHAVGVADVGGLDIHVAHRLR